jgi:hypothetical protein
MSAPELSQNILDLALRYLACGLSIIPIKTRDKRPALASWKEYQKRLPTEAELHSWFAGRDDLNLAIVTGEVSRVVVVDGDSPEAVAWINSHYPSPMRTGTAKGAHYYFLHPGHEVRNGAKLGGMALDVRGDGGYVVAPGSTHPSGSIYTEEGCWWDIDGLPVFQASWLGERIQPLVQPQAALERRVKAYLSRIPGEGEGGRDNQGFKVACKLVREFALTEETARGFLSDWNQTCNPPMAEEDLDRLINSAAKSGRATMGSKLEARTWSAPSDGAAGSSVDDGGSGNLRELLSHNDKGAIRKTPGNLAKILRLDPAWGPNLALNEMTRDVIFNGQVVGDTFVDWVQEVMEDHYGVPWGREDVQAKILSQATMHSIHPVREWLKNLPPWDQEERIRRIPAEVLKSEGASLEAQYIIRTMIAAVRRVMEPGCKVDTVTVLVGPQGVGKSTFWRVLVGGQWFGDSPIDLENKDGFMVLHRRWFTELSEIDHATGNRAAERIKAFLSSCEDTFRPPFGKAVGVFRRSCIIVGTTNRADFLVDPTGSRRFWPMKVVGPVDLVKLKLWREQIWAEALNMYQNNVPHWLDVGMETIRAEQAGAYEVEDPWEGQVDLALAILSRAGRHLSLGVQLADLMTTMGLPVSQQNRAASMKLAAILKSRDWRLERPWLEGRAQRLWFPPGGFSCRPLTTSDDLA